MGTIGEEAESEGRNRVRSQSRSLVVCVEHRQPVEEEQETVSLGTIDDIEYDFGDSREIDPSLPHNVPGEENDDGR